MATERLIGIDFGTSTSVVKCKRYTDGAPVGDAHHTESVTFGQGVSDPKAVTLVRLNEDGSVDCGIDEEIPGSTIYREFKMMLESENEEEREKAKELTHEYMKYLYHSYSLQKDDYGAKDDLIRTIVSFPAKWKDETRQFMTLAVSDAGFENVSSIDEPSAALYAVMARHMNVIRDNALIDKDRDNLILVVDMGAGTTDLAVCKCTVSTESDNVKAEDISNDLILSWPDDNVNITFGGREIDIALKGYLIDYIASCGLPKELAENFISNNTGVKTWKEETLSPSLGKGESVVSCNVAKQAQTFAPFKKPFPTITRESFEKLIEEKLNGYIELLTGCLDKLEENSEIDVVILTGGHSGWYFAKEIIDGSMPGLDHPALRKIRENKNRVMSLSNPQETVALGMVYSKLPFKITKNRKPVEVKAEPQTITETEHPALTDAQSSDNIKSVLETTFSAYPLPDDVDNIRNKLAINPNQTVYFAKDCLEDSSGKAAIVITEGGVYSTARGGNYVYHASWKSFLQSEIEITDDSLIRHNGNFRNIIYAAADVEVQQILKNLQQSLADSGISIEKLEPKIFRQNRQIVVHDVVSAFLKKHAGTLREVSYGNEKGLRTYLQVSDGETIYYYKDTTLFNSGKNGFVLSDKGLYYRELWSNPNHIGWYTFAKRTEITYIESKNLITLTFNKVQNFRFYVSVRQDAAKLFNILTELQNELKGDDDNALSAPVIASANASSAPVVASANASSAPVVASAKTDVGILTENTTETPYAKTVKEFLNKKETMTVGDFKNIYYAEFSATQENTVNYMISEEGILDGVSKNCICVTWSTFVNCDILEGTKDGQLTSTVATIALPFDGEEIALVCNNPQETANMLREIKDKLVALDSTSPDAMEKLKKRKEFFDIIASECQKLNSETDYMQLAANLNVTVDSKVFYASTYEDKSGTMITDRGIFSDCRFQPGLGETHLVTWAEFLSGTITNHPVDGLKLCCGSKSKQLYSCRPPVDSEMVDFYKELQKNLLAHSSVAPDINVI